MLYYVGLILFYVQWVGPPTSFSSLSLQSQNQTVTNIQTNVPDPLAWEFSFFNHILIASLVFLNSQLQNIEPPSLESYF